MIITDYSIQELLFYTFLGFVIIIAMFRVAIWSLDNVIGRLFSKLLKYIKNFPNKYGNRGVKK